MVYALYSNSLTSQAAAYGTNLRATDPLLMKAPEYTLEWVSCSREGPSTFLVTLQLKDIAFDITALFVLLTFQYSLGDVANLLLLLKHLQFLSLAKELSY